MSPRRRALVASLLCAAGLAACAPENRPPSGSPEPLLSRDLSPQEFQLLTDREKVRYRNVVLRIPDAWGGGMLPLSRGPYPDVLEKAVHTGELEALMAYYNRAQFELEHPRVRVEFINFDMWSLHFRSMLAVALAANRAPAVYIAKDLPHTIEQGMFADITELVKEWDRAHEQPESARRDGTVDGRTYTISHNEFGGSLIRYRKDWFREAGILNEHGEPGPRSDWTWDDFRAICKELTDPAKKRWGFAGQTNDFFYQDAYGIRPYIPDRSGKRTWRFNDQDPRMLESLKAARAMVREDQSIATSVTMGWFESHGEFDAGRAAMISSFSPHIAREFLEQPDKFGKDKPFGETVGMALPPRGPTGHSGFKIVTNPFGFDPTLDKEQLRAAFDWTKSLFYGDIFENYLRAVNQKEKALGKRSFTYQVLLTTPYSYDPKLLDRPLSEVFPGDYLRIYDVIRKSPAPPLPREFGLREPPITEWESAIRALYSEAVLSPSVDLEALLRRTADMFNRTILDFRTEGDREKLERYYDTLGEYYRKNFPRYYREEWPGLYERYYRVAAP